MATWYVGSVQYAAVAQFAASTAYSVGQIIRQLAAPAVGSERCFRCTTAGTTAGSEPSWNLTKGATTTSGTAVFTEVTGNSTYNWSAPAARLLLIYTNFAAAGDTIYVAHNHAETQSTTMSLTSQGTSQSPLTVLCVNASGSVPPVAADLATTGTVSTTGATNVTLGGSAYIYGLTFSAGSSTSLGLLNVNTGAAGSLVLQACGLVLGGNHVNARFVFGGVQSDVTLFNTTLTFNSTSQSIQLSGGRLKWLNTLSALGGATFPTLLMTAATSTTASVVFDGVDLSALGSGATLAGTPTACIDFTVLNCKLGASVGIQTTLSVRDGTETSVIISDSTSSTYRQERYLYEGALTPELTYVLTGGASDGTTPISWKVVSTAFAKPLFPFKCFPIAAWNTSTSLVTATVEIESTATLTNADVWLEIESLDTSGYPISTLHSSAPATPLTAATNLPTSSASWAGGLGGAVKQYLQVTFTPALVGLVRGTVKVGKASQTLYINPQIILS